MNRSRAYRRFMKQKTKKHIKNIVKNIWGVPELSNDPKVIGKLANHGNLCSCQHCFKQRQNVNTVTHKLTKREIFSLDELNNWEIKYV